MKKLMVLATLLVCHVMSVSAYDFYSKTEFSVEEALDSVNLYYSINPDMETVSLTIGPEAYNFKHIRIPETVVHNDTTYTVTEITHNAFSGGSINIVEMANTITKIGDRAFYDCGIDSIKFSSSLKSIGEYAFWDSNLTGVYLPEGLEVIGKAAFSGDTNYYGQPTGNIRTISLPSTLTDIEASAFANNYYLNDVVIPDKITEIKESVFSRCWKLSNVTLPKNLTKIGNYAFHGCTIIELGENFFPETLEAIGDEAFSYNIHGGTAVLKKVVLPDNIKSVGYRCFSQKSLESITFSSGMTELPNLVCSGCSNLVEVIIPNSITKIGESAFSSTTLLSHIDLPASITEIGYGAFQSSGLVSFTFPPNIEIVDTYFFKDCAYLEEVNFSNKIKSIATEAFRDCKSLKKIDLPASLETLGTSVFVYCEALEEVNMAECNLKTIPGSTFQSCSSLKKISLPDSLATIQACAFINCTSLSEIEIPHSLETLSERAFYGCTSLANITIPHNVSGWGKECFYGCTNLKEVHYKRAVVPSLSSTIRLIEDGNQCTLYIPTGSKDEYEACNNWNNFYAIVEEEIGYDILYRVSVSKTGKGVVTVNESTSANTDILSGTNVKLSIVPDNGWEIGTVLIDGVDVSAECADGEYEIETLDRNISVAVTFEELPAILQLKQADGGSIDIPVVKGTQFTCTFTVEEGWKINNVRYNNLDITSALEEGNKYTTPAIKNDAILSVAYEKPGDSSVSSLESESNVKAYVMNDGTLVVLGVENASPINIVTADGKIEATLIAQNGRASHQLKEHGVYLVNTPDKTIKVAY